MKRSTRRAIIRDEHAFTHKHAENMEAMRTVRYFATSVAQGDPRRVTSILAVLGGTVLSIASEFAQGSTQLRPAVRPLAVGGRGLYAIAAVNEAGNLFAEVAQAIHGQPEVPKTYDVTDTPHTLSTSVSSSSTRNGLADAMLPALLGAGAGAAGATAATAAGAGAAGAAAADAAGAAAAAAGLASLAAADAALKEKVRQQIVNDAVRNGYTQQQAETIAAGAVDAGPRPGQTASAGGPLTNLLPTPRDIAAGTLGGPIGALVNLATGPVGGQKQEVVGYDPWGNPHYTLESVNAATAEYLRQAAATAPKPTTRPTQIDSPEVAAFKRKNGGVV